MTCSDGGLRAVRFLSWWLRATTICREHLLQKKKEREDRHRERELKHALLPSQIPIKQLLPKEVWRSMHVRSQKSDEK